MTIELICHDPKPRLTQMECMCYAQWHYHFGAITIFAHVDVFTFISNKFSEINDINQFIYIHINHNQ